MRSDAASFVVPNEAARAIRQCLLCLLPLLYPSDLTSAAQGGPIHSLRLKIAWYEAEIVKRGMDSITVQPLVADEAFMPHVEAVYVPFHMEYGILICY